MTDLDDGQEGTDKKSIGIGKNEEIENGCLFYMEISVILQIS